MQPTLNPTLLQLALHEDLSDIGDITSQSIFPPDVIISSTITAKDAGVIAGLFVVTAVYQHIDPQVEVSYALEDGATVSNGTLVCTIKGPAQSILSGERTALNFLQRLSGVATMTNRFVQQIVHTRTAILDTRKTTPGWRALEKYAVQMGGGQNHRMGLYDAVMIKDNHIDAAGSITRAVEAVRAYPPANHVKIIVEVRDMLELEEALHLAVDQVLLDNMTTQQMREAVVYVNGRVKLEASGNMSLERVKAVAETGVDYISVGALTHSAPILDLSMRLK